MLHFVVLSALAASPMMPHDNEVAIASRKSKKMTAYARQTNVNSEENESPTQPVCTPPECNPTRWSMEVRGAGFYPLNEKLRKVFDNWWPTLEWESSYSFVKGLWQDCDQWSVWANVSWASKTGHSEGFGYHCRLNLMPVAAGVEYQVNFARYFDFYVGVGPSYSWMWIKNKDGFETTHHRRSQFGVLTKTGFRFTFCTNYFFDVFGDYFFTQFRHVHDPIQPIGGQVMGFFVGGGFGGKW